MDLELTTGSVTVRHGSLQAFAVYRRQPSAPEQPLHLAEYDPESGIKRLGPAETTPSSNNSRIKKNWTKKRISVPNGSIIKYAIQRVLPTGTYRAQQHLFAIRARDLGPLQDISIECPSDEFSTARAIHIIGRFDILSEDEVKTLGLHLNKIRQDESAQFDTDEFRDIFSVRVLEKEIAAPRAPILKEIQSDPGRKVLKIVRRRRLSI